MEKLHGQPVLSLAKLSHPPTPEPPSGEAAGNSHNVAASELCPGSESTSCVMLWDTNMCDVQRTAVSDGASLTDR